ncbi:MAG: hypothetical protein AB7E79_11775 [Rhodospirillaceae bacterium]
MRFRVGISLMIVSALAAGCARAAETSSLPPWFALDVNGLIDARLALTSGTLSWEEGGLGKVRWGSSDGDPGVIARPEGALVVQPRFGFDLEGFVHLQASSQQRPAVDVVEAYLAYETPPSSRFGLQVKGGFFFPHISVENTGLAWTSPYTITSSAINTWIGEELRTVGGEITATWRPDALSELGTTGSVYYFNDPTGTLLAWRGWTLSDREAGLFDRIRVPMVRLIAPGAPLDEQALTEEPFHEIDAKQGYYLGAHAAHEDYGRLQIHWYNNNADDRELKFGQWAWRTKFWSAGYTSPSWADITFLAQAMTGTTTVITRPAPRGPFVDTKFWSVYGLVSKEWDRHRLSLRLERFGADDRDTSVDDNNERGTGITAAYVYRPADRHRLTLEVLHVSSRRPERIFLGFPEKAKETVLQASYRLFFGTGN